ncbi:hypothetical protein ACFQ3R_06610 [Mesonia ostreae]|uniref:Uncharacterized protein n=1 Tax=Mesonia ostreae TaxID=861110 RepID=A0ABU2KGZ7_9FLAO|nr:hypothetical protein [Mesonia ostreae]MDT0293988.1 hypothetical protein [Mesonia ostreae]
MLAKEIPEQRHWIISYFDVGKLLYLSLGLFVLESFIYGRFLIHSYQKESSFWIFFWMVCFIFSFVHIFLVLMDGWSRFQNYKRVKDQFYMYGFITKTANHYKGSKCQRNAILVASKELGLEREAISFYKRQGIKWYYFIPQFMVKDPLFMLKNSFWSRTFMEKKYTAKIDFSKIHSDQIQSTFSIKSPVRD